MTKMVRTTNRLRLVTSCCGVFGALSERFTVGMVSAPKASGVIQTKSKNKILVKRFKGDPRNVLYDFSCFCVKNVLIFKQYFVKMKTT